MQSYYRWKTRALLVTRPVVTAVYNRSSRRIMRWRNNRPLAFGVISFISGCILTLLLCSFNDSALQRTRESQMKQQGGQYVRDENLPRIAMKPGGTANIDGAIPDQLQGAAIPARKPTLPAYPPRV